MRPLIKVLPGFGRVSARQPTSCLARPKERDRCCGAKVAKTNEVQPGHIKYGGREIFGGQTNSLRSDKVCLFKRAFAQGARQQAPVKGEVEGRRDWHSIYPFTI